MNGKIYKVFDLFDVNHSGDIDFNEFYLLTCMLIAIKVFKNKEINKEIKKLIKK